MIDYLYIDGVKVHPSNPATNNFLSVLKLGGLGTPPIRQELLPLARRHGVIDRTEFYGPRLIDIAGRVVADTNSEVLDQLDALKTTLILGTTHVLKFRRQNMAEDERLEVVVAGELEFDLEPRRPFHLYWNVQLLAADPRIYTDQLKSATYDPAAVLTGTGFSVPLTFPIDFGDNPGERLQVTNLGNFTTPPILTATGPWNDVRIDNETTGKSFITTCDLAAASDDLVIDIGARTVHLNGTPRIDLVTAAGTSWWELALGDNFIRGLGSGMSAGTTLLKVEHRDARI